MSRYRKKPVVIEAVQLRWSTWSEMCDHLGDIIGPHNESCRTVDECNDDCGETAPFMELTIPTLEGDHLARHGDWIIKGVEGEFYPCRPDIFEKTYEPAND